MKIFITGANGYLGAEIYNDLVAETQYDICGGYFGPNNNKSLVCLDVSNAVQTAEVINKAKPDVIVHVAAVAHGENSLDESLLNRVNVQGTQNVVNAALQTGSKIIFLSSVGALHNVPYGKSKLAGENIVKASGLEYLIIRPSVIIGLSPNQETNLTFNKILEAIKSNGTVEEDNKWKFQPTWINHVSEVVKLWLGGEFKDSEPIYPLVSEVKTRYEISNDILKHFGLSARPVNKPRYEADTILNSDSLTKNNLPVYHYDFVIGKIVDELKDLVRP